MDSVSKGPAIYGAPGNIRRIDSLFCNLRVLRKHRLTVPKTPGEMLAVARTLDAAGIPLMAVGSRDPWTLVLLVFESLLVAREGTKCHRDYFEGVCNSMTCGWSACSKRRWSCRGISIQTTNT